MKVKYRVSIIIVGVVTALCSVSQAIVDLRRIEEVTRKSVLTQDDLQVIDDFMSDAVTDLVRTEDFSAIGEIREIILNHRADKAQSSARPQYTEQFSESARKHISAAIDEADTLENRANRVKVLTNLMILVENLADPDLVDVAVAQIRRPDSPVRYWAVRAATDSDVWTAINQDAATASRLTATILTECSKVTTTSDAETLRLMADFSARINSAAANDLLARVADARIAAYANWTVGRELVDGTILKHLCDKLTAGGTPNPDLARRFGQLYSFVMERYIKGLRLGAIGEMSVPQLIAVLVQTEQSCLGRLLGAPQATITRMVEASNLDGLQAEHDRLLGTADHPGALPTRLGFAYGNDGQTRPDPIALPDPPQRSALP
jgi:hypothetical protein